MAKKILIIEDDKFLRQLISRKLEREGYQVVEAVDGEEGYKKIKPEMPDLVLLDLILPGIDGFEFLSKVKEDDTVNKIPIIILSNLGQKEDIDRGLKLGAVDYLIKAHFTPSEIIEKVRTVLKEK
jgi:DNA-binding response OmpR family regulator